MSKHAPSPWKFTKQEYYKSGGFAAEIFDANGLVVARVYDWGKSRQSGGKALTEEQKQERLDGVNATATMMAAASEMFEVLHRLAVKSGDPCNCLGGDMAGECDYCVARAVLIRAGG